MDSRFSRENNFNPNKGYISCLLKQGVPLVDADWNELDDIRRNELRTFIKWFIGDGIPDTVDGTRNDAFQITAISSDDRNDNFLILAGGIDALSSSRCLVDGVDVFITQDIEFKSQPLHENYEGPQPPNSPDLTPVDPEAPKIAAIPLAAGTYRVYLDVWEWKVDSSVDRPHLINDLIGVETCLRLKRTWAIRIFKEEEEVKLPNHSYYLLATINRPTDSAAITPELITDKRRVGINVSKYLKAPFYIKDGTDVIDSTSLQMLLRLTQITLLHILQKNSFFLDEIIAANPTDSPSKNHFELRKRNVYFAFQNISQICTTGIMKCRCDVINYSDAIQIMVTLYEYQKAFLSTLIASGNKTDAKIVQFIKEYYSLLARLNEALNNSDLLNAIYSHKSLIATLLGKNNFSVAEYIWKNWGNLITQAFAKLIENFPSLVNFEGEAINDSEKQYKFLAKFSDLFLDVIIECHLTTPTSVIGNAALFWHGEILGTDFNGLKPEEVYAEFVQKLKSEIAKSILSNEQIAFSSAILDQVSLEVRRLPSLPL